MYENKREANTLRNEASRLMINQRFFLSRRNTNGNMCKLNGVCSFFPSENRSISIGRNSLSREGKTSSPPTKISAFRRAATPR